MKKTTNSKDLNNEDDVKGGMARKTKLTKRKKKPKRRKFRW